MPMTEDLRSAKETGMNALEEVGAWLSEEKVFGLPGKIATGEILPLERVKMRVFSSRASAGERMPMDFKIGDQLVAPSNSSVLGLESRVLRLWIAGSPGTGYSGRSIQKGLSHAQ